MTSGVCCALRETPALRRCIRAAFSETHSDKEFHCTLGCGLVCRRMADAGAHVLVVDDHRDIRDALSRYLQSSGLRVSVADSAAAARRMLKERDIELIVLDI